MLRFLPLAQKLARRYSRSPAPPEDLEQVASLGLVKAVDRFDPDRGSSFPAFATPTILGELSATFATRAGRFTCRATPRSGLKRSSRRSAS